LYRGGWVRAGAEVVAGQDVVGRGGSGGDHAVVDHPGRHGYGGDFPTSWFLTTDHAATTPGTQQDVGTRGPEWLSYDATNQVLVETSIYEKGSETDNNAMSEVTVIDPHSGTCCPARRS